MNNKIEICKLDSLAEEEIKFLVNNQEVIGFNVSPQKLEVGKEYEVEIDIFINDSLDIEEQKDQCLKKVKHVNNYSYILWGKMLEDNILDVGFFITSDLFEDYQYLIGHFVYLKVDRLQVYCEN
ncbi:MULTISPECIES: hypothetical protein [Priestia]|uniref:hypothetical protein n=1 Tax=Priestia TaxID=2800373 RepID=UPI00064AF15D|nr:hypothetical protein [Priestia megaterium]MEC1067905.1 hypothetical protein [Priestia megaterium]MED3882696.1 hypothetical protein [Priestia megaterium]MED3978961.1 hypothetical protein [Priestia megaterium]SDD47582.1 hypothetical protein SAMN04487777_103828 [Priestia aryabhattai B8W22]